jgi:uncharacterized protein YraI
VLINLKTTLLAIKVIVVTGSALGTMFEMAKAMEARNLVRTNMRTGPGTKARARAEARTIFVAYGVLTSTLL